ncbi:MAG: hypothetical protein EZS28_025289, partial [Streblomastix strix]
MSKIEEYGIAQDLQPLWNNEIPQRTDQSLFTPVDPPELTINKNQQQFNSDRDFWVQRSYAISYLGLKTSEEHHIGLGKGLLNVTAFIQRHVRQVYLTINDCEAFWSEVDTDLYLDTVRMELDEDDNHQHHHDHDHDHDHNHRHDKERYDKNDQLDLVRGRKRRRVISSEDSGFGQNNDDWSEGHHREIERQQLRKFRIRRNRREQALPPVQTVTGAPVYMPNLRTAQEEAFRIANNISPNRDEESSVFWTSAESINQERNTPIANFRMAQQLLTAQDNQEQLNQQVNKQIQQQINQLHEINREIQIQQQDVTVNNTQNEQRQQIEAINLEQNTQQHIQNILLDDQGDINNENQQPTQIGATHTPQTEAPYNLQHQQVGQNDDLNNMVEQTQFQPTQNFPGLLNITHQTSLSETGSLNEQQQLSLSLSPSSSSITQIKQNQQPSQKQYLFVTDPNNKFIKGIQQSKYIPIEEAVNRLPLLSEDPKGQVEIKVYTGEQIQHINKMEQNDIFQNMTSNMMNKFQNHSNEDVAMRLRMEILNKLLSEEQQRIKRGFGPQMRLTSFYESQIQRKITEQNNSAIHIDTNWGFCSGTGEQQDEFQKNFMDESQQLEIRPLDKNNKKHKSRKHQRSQEKQRNKQAQAQWQYNNLVLDSHLGPLFSQMNYSGPPGRDLDRSNIKLRSRQPHQQKAMDIPKGIQLQQNAGEAAQVQHAPRETFSTNGNVRKVAFSTDSIVSGQIWVAGTKPINIQTAPSIQLQGNPICEPKVGKKGGRTPVRGKATSTNTSAV